MGAVAVRSVGRRARGKRKRCKRGTGVGHSRIDGHAAGTARRYWRRAHAAGTGAVRVRVLGTGTARKTGGQPDGERACGLANAPADSRTANGWAARRGDGGRARAGASRHG